MSEDFEFFRLDMKCQSQVGNVYDRLVCFQVWSVSVAGLSGGGSLILKQDRKFFKTRWLQCRTRREV